MAWAKVPPATPGEPTHEIGGRHIAHHNGPHRLGIAAGIAAGHHTEDAAKRDAVEGGSDQVVIQHNEEAIQAHIHEHGRLPILFAEIHPMGRVLQQVPVSSGLAAHQKRKHHTQTEDHEAEDVG